MSLVNTELSVNDLLTGMNVRIIKNTVEALREEKVYEGQQ